MRSPNSKAGIKARRLIEAAKQASGGFANKMFGEMYTHAVEQHVYEGNSVFLKFMASLERAPVSPEEFLDSEDFMGATDLLVWPEARKAFIEINKDWWKGPEYAYKEAVFAGSTSSSKSEQCKMLAAYRLHILGCLKDPQKLYGLPTSTSIVFTIQAAKPHVTKKVIYTPLRNYIETMPWFQRHMRPNKLIDAEMQFDEQNIRVVPGGSDSDTILGEAILFSILDEVNFMNVVQNSKKSNVGTGRAGSYDQAQSIYDAVTKRKKSRFLYSGPQIGLICVASSTRYKGDFTDRRIKYVKDEEERGVFIFNKAQYDVWPQDRYCGDKFRIVVENEAATDIRILGDEERVPDSAAVYEIPVEYLDDFQKDPTGSLRDIVGISVNSVNPFFKRRFKIVDAISKGVEEGLESILYRDNVVLGVDGMPQVKQGIYCRNPRKPRYIHIDLASTMDSAGIGMVRFDGLRAVERSGGVIEHLPVASVEIACSIKPDHSNEIDIAEIRAWVKQLKNVYGYPIRSVSYDFFGSLESRQQWKKSGMPTSLISVDKTLVPYLSFRDAINDDRILLYPQPVLEEEMYSLEYDEKANGGKGKVDHSTRSEKDVSDAVVGAYYNMLKRSSTWASNTDDDRMLDTRADLGDRDDFQRPI